MSYKYNRPAINLRGENQEGMEWVPTNEKPKQSKSEQSLWNEGYTRHLLSE